MSRVSLFGQGVFVLGRMFLFAASEETCRERPTLAKTPVQAPTIASENEAAFFKKYHRCTEHRKHLVDEYLVGHY